VDPAMTGSQKNFPLASLPFIKKTQYHSEQDFLKLDHYIQLFLGYLKVVTNEK
jgi:hypothetical protein